MSLLIQTRSSVTGRFFTGLPTPLMGAGLLVMGLLGLILLATGCGDDGGDASGEVATANLRLEARSSVGASGDQLEFRDPGGTLYTLTSLQIAVEEIELDLPVNVTCGDLRGRFSRHLDCDEEGVFGGEDQVRLVGPIIFDVLEGTSIPDVSALEIPAVNYQEADLEVDTARVEDELVDIEDEMIDRTVVAYADFESDNQKHQLRLDFSFKAEAKAGADDPMSMNLAQGDTLVLVLDIARWLEAIPITRCLERGELKASDGVVTLDQDSIGDCEDAESTFEANFQRSLQVRIERANRSPQEEQ